MYCSTIFSMLGREKGEFGMSAEQQAAVVRPVKCCAVYSMHEQVCSACVQRSVTLLHGAFSVLVARLT